MLENITCIMPDTCYNIYNKKNKMQFGERLYLTLMCLIRLLECDCGLEAFSHPLLLQ